MVLQVSVTLVNRGLTVECKKECLPHLIFWPSLLQSCFSLEGSGFCSYPQDLQTVSPGLLFCLYTVRTIKQEKNINSLAQSILKSHSPGSVASTFRTSLGKQGTELLGAPWGSMVKQCFFYSWYREDGAVKEPATQRFWDLKGKADLQPALWLLPILCHTEDAVWLQSSTYTDLTSCRLLQKLR